MSENRTFKAEWRTLASLNGDFQSTRMADRAKALAGVELHEEDWARRLLILTAKVKRPNVFICFAISSEANADFFLIEVHRDPETGEYAVAWGDDTATDMVSHFGGSLLRDFEAFVEA